MNEKGLGGRDVWIISVPSLNFFLEPKTAKKGVGGGLLKGSRGGGGVGTASCMAISCAVVTKVPAPRRTCGWFNEEASPAPTVLHSPHYHKHLLTFN